MNGKVKIDGTTHVVREQVIQVTVSPSDIEHDVDTVRLQVILPNSRPRSIVLRAEDLRSEPGYLR